MWNKIIIYIKSLIDSTNENSHKVFLAILSWVLFLCIIVVSWFGVITPDIIIVSNLGIILGQSSLSVIEKFIKK